MNNLCEGVWVFWGMGIVKGDCWVKGGDRCEVSGLWEEVEG